MQNANGVKDKPASSIWRLTAKDCLVSKHYFGDQDENAQVLLEGLNNQEKTVDGVYCTR